MRILAGGEILDHSPPKGLRVLSDPLKNHRTTWKMKDLLMKTKGQEEPEG